jgi:aminocarboxymuconate-semialdehyde decarboxylase
VEAFGADHVPLGSDYPFDMGMMDCVRQVRALGVSEQDRGTILGQAAAGLLEGASLTAVRVARGG